jgi:hypothetical protein
MERRGMQCLGRRARPPVDQVPLPRLIAAGDPKRTVPLRLLTFAIVPARRTLPRWRRAVGHLNPK